MKFFVRYTQNPQEDVKRGYSFDSYRLFQTAEECAEEYGLSDGEYQVADYGDNPGYYFDGLGAQWVVAPTTPDGEAWGMMLDGP